MAEDITQNPIPQVEIKPPRHHVTTWVALVIIAAIAATVGYLVWAKSQEAWPFDDDGPWNEVRRDEMAGWKTYRNDKYGLEFKYPYGYVISHEDENGISLSSSENCRIILSTTPPAWPKDCYGYNLLIQDGKILVEGQGVVKTPAKVAGYSAEHIEDSNVGILEDQYQTIVQFNKGNDWYISAMGFNLENKAKAETTLDQILSTFKFTFLDLDAEFDMKNKVPGTKLYFSERFGIGFTYEYGDSLTITEIGNKIYLHGIKQEPEGGNSIEVFAKDPNESISEAIEGRFLKGYNPEDCYVVIDDVPSEFDLRSGYMFASISYPPPDDPEAPWFENSSKCPVNYSATNAAQYFLFNTDVPTKYLFLQTGQDSIASDGRPITEKGGYNWSTSVRIVK